MYLLNTKCLTFDRLLVSEYEMLKVLVCISGGFILKHPVVALYIYYYYLLVSLTDLRTVVVGLRGSLLSS